MRAWSRENGAGVAIEAGKGRELAAVIAELAQNKARCAEYGAKARAMIGGITRAMERLPVEIASAPTCRSGR